jgi:single-stranded DNA-binding protein
MNQVQIIGTVGKDAEIKQVANGEMALFTVATTERYKDKAGENKHTSILSCFREKSTDKKNATRNINRSY